MDGYVTGSSFGVWLYSLAGFVNWAMLFVIDAFAMSVLVLAWRRWKFRPIFLLIAFYAIQLFVVCRGLFRHVEGIMALHSGCGEERINPAYANGPVREFSTNINLPLADILLALAIYLIYRRLSGIGGRVGGSDGQIKPPDGTARTDGI